MLEFLLQPTVQSLILSPIIGLILGIVADKIRSNRRHARPNNSPQRQMTTGDWNVSGENISIRNQSDDHYNINIKNNINASGRADQSGNELLGWGVAALLGASAVILGYSFYHAAIYHIVNMALTVSMVALGYSIAANWLRGECSLPRTVAYIAMVASVIFIGQVSLDDAARALTPNIQAHIANAYYQYKLLAIFHIQGPIQLWVLLQALGVALTLLSAIFLLMGTFGTGPHGLQVSVGIGAVILASMGLLMTTGEAFELVRSYAAL